MSHFKLRSGATALIAGLMVVALAACATPPAATSAPATSVTGKLVFEATTPLPADAVAEINLVDITVESGEPQVVGSQQITIGSQASPIAFTVKYDASKINKEHTYGIAAKIVKGNEVYFVTTAPKDVLTQGNPSSDVEVPLAPGGPEAPAGG
jgi:uncharacterized lipoprotein YbaY